MLSLPPGLALRALDSAPDAIVIIGRAGLIRAVNRQVSAMFGYAKDELLGQPIERLIPERFRAQHRTDREGYVRDPHLRPMGVGLELFGLRRDGTEFPVEISLSPIEDDAGPLVAAAIRDVTEHRRIEAELRHLQSITDTALSSENTETLILALLARLRAALHTDTATILLADAEGRYLVPCASDGMEAEVGGEIEVPIGQGVAGRVALSQGPVIFEDLSAIDVISPVLRSRVRSLIGIALKREGHLVGVVHAGSSVRRKFTQDEARLLSLAADRIGLAIERTRLHEVEQAARRAADAARESADRANRAKSRFLATASHDLRQPLQTLSLLHGTLRRASLDDSTRIEALTQQEQAIAAMSRLLNALLDISKLESGAIKPDPSDFAVKTLFEELRCEFASLANDKGLTLRVANCEDSAYSDPSLVGQILRNLVSNAIKYTRAGWVDLRCLHEQPSLVRIEVLDTGIGIPADKLQYIYDEFYQIGVPPNATREGYGLGLSIVQRIARLLDVQLDVHSEVGKGSVFALTLPVAVGRSAVRPGPQRVEAGSLPAGPTNTRVLLVDDDPAVLKATRMLLRSEGYEVTATLSKAEALQEVLAEPRIDLLITDYHLTDGETGMQVIAAVREALDRRVKAVLMTGDTSSMIKDLDHDPYLRIASKPVNADELLILLRTLLEAS